MENRKYKIEIEKKIIFLTYKNRLRQNLQEYQIDLSIPTQFIVFYSLVMFDVFNQIYLKRNMESNVHLHVCAVFCKTAIITLHPLWALFNNSPVTDIVPIYLIRAEHRKVTPIIPF